MGISVGGEMLRAWRDGGLYKETFEMLHLSRRISGECVTYGNDAIDSGIVIVTIDGGPASPIHRVTFSNILKLSHSFKHGEWKAQLLKIVNLNRVNNAFRRRFPLWGGFGCGRTLFHITSAYGSKLGTWLGVIGALVKMSQLPCSLQLIR